MAVAHLTIHGYGTWLPDHHRGWHSRSLGAQPTNEIKGSLYRSRMQRNAKHFPYRLQRTAIVSLQTACRYQEIDLIAAAADPSHFHLLIHWADDRGCVDLSRSLKTSMTMTLNDVTQQAITWFSKKCGHTEVRTEEHLEHLIENYFPTHRGWMWSRRHGWTTPRAPKRR